MRNTSKYLRSKKVNVSGCIAMILDNINAYLVEKVTLA